MVEPNRSKASDVRNATPWINNNTVREIKPRGGSAVKSRVRPALRFGEPCNAAPGPPAGIAITAKGPMVPRCPVTFVPKTAASVPFPVTAADLPGHQMEPPITPVENLPPSVDGPPPVDVPPQAAVPAAPSPADPPVCAEKTVADAFGINTNQSNLKSSVLAAQPFPSSARNVELLHDEPAVFTDGTSGYGILLSRTRMFADPLPPVITDEETLLINASDSQRLINQPLSWAIFALRTAIIAAFVFYLLRGYDYQMDYWE